MMKFPKCPLLHSYGTLRTLYYVVPLSLHKCFCTINSAFSHCTILEIAFSLGLFRSDMARWGSSDQEPEAVQERRQGVSLTCCPCHGLGASQSALAAWEALLGLGLASSWPPETLQENSLSGNFTVRLMANLPLLLLMIKYTYKSRNPQGLLGSILFSSPSLFPLSLS